MLEETERLSAETVWGHEVRTHVQILLSAVQMLDCDKLKENQKKKYLDILRQHALEMLEITHRTMEPHGLLGREPNMQWQCAERVLHRCLQAVEPAARAKGMEVIEDIENDLWMAFDEQMLSRILYNLLFNAVKFNRENGYIHLKAEKHEGCVEICVSDTGYGISEERMASLFRINEQDVARGHGMGLYLSGVLVDKMGGTIYCESRQEEGTTFMVRMPEGRRPEWAEEIGSFTE